MMDDSTGLLGLAIRQAEKNDIPLVFSLIRELAEYVRLADEVTADENILAEHFFGERKFAEALLVFQDGNPAGFAIYFHNFSTFLGRPGLYLEDLFVRPEYRGRGIGKALLKHLAGLAVERGCGRVEWLVLDWNERAKKFYRQLGSESLDDYVVFRLTGDKLAEFAG